MAGSIGFSQLSIMIFGIDAFLCHSCLLKTNLIAIFLRISFPTCLYFLVYKASCGGPERLQGLSRLQIISNFPLSVANNVFCGILIDNYTYRNTNQVVAELSSIQDYLKISKLVINQGSDICCLPEMAYYNLSITTKYITTVLNKFK